MELISFLRWHNSQIHLDYFASFLAVSCVAATIQTICFADVNKQSSVAVLLPLSWILIFFFLSFCFFGSSSRRTYSESLRDHQ